MLLKTRKGGRKGKRVEGRRRKREGKREKRMEGKKEGRKKAGRQGREDHTAGEGWSLQGSHGGTRLSAMLRGFGSLLGLCGCRTVEGF